MSKNSIENLSRFDRFIYTKYPFNKKIRVLVMVFGPLGIREAPPEKLTKLSRCDGPAWLPLTHREGEGVALFHNLKGTQKL